MTDLEFIKKFSKITVKRVCDENNISASNLWSGRLNKDKVHKVRKAIEAEMGEIYVQEFRSK